MAVLIHKSKTSTGELWQGSVGDLAHPEKYDVIVLCADEFQDKEGQLSASYGKSVRVLPAPNDDSGNPFTKEQATIAVVAARQVVKEYRLGKRILVSCAMGRNRSGLVMALALSRLCGVSGNDAIKVIREKVPHALSNPQFVDFLASV